MIILNGREGLGINKTVTDPTSVLLCPIYLSALLTISTATG